jgi:DNA-directed RNA polymerase alpha subunit
LIADRILYVGQLVQKSDQDIFRIPHSGRKSLNEIKALLASMDLSLGMSLPDWSLPDDLDTEVATNYNPSAQTEE